MKTREDLYGKEAGEVLRCIGEYHCIHREQLHRIFPDMKERLDAMLYYLLHHERIFCDSETADIFFDNAKRDVDKDMLSAIWILCDFMERVEYHSAGEYPVKILFFAEGEMYEVIAVPQGKETLMNCALAAKQTDSKRIVIVENISQAEQVDIPGTAAYCLVNRKSGDVEYYTVEE